MDLRRTNPFLRAALALFTALIIAAAVGLFVVQFEVTGAAAIAVTTALASMACLGAAEVLVARYRCYRFGVEDSFAVAAVVLSAVSGAKLMAAMPAVPLEAVNAELPLSAAAGAFAIYRRFDVSCMAVRQHGLRSGDTVSTPDRPGRASAHWRPPYSCVVFAVQRDPGDDRHRSDDFPGDEYGAVQAAALVGGYAVLNVQLTPRWYMRRRLGTTGSPTSPSPGWRRSARWASICAPQRSQKLMDAGLLLLSRHRC